MPWPRLFPAAIVLAALACASAAIGNPVAADSSATVFVESKSAVVGDGFSTDVIAILPPDVTLSSFDIQLSFDERSVIPLGSRLPDGWQPEPQSPPSPGAYRLSGGRGSARCAGPGSCTLGSIAWKAQAASDSSIRVVSATLQTDNGPLTVGSLTAGLVHIPEAETAVSSASSQDSGLGLANLGVLLLVCALAGAAIAGPIVLGVRRLRSRKPAPAVAPPSAVAPAPARIAQSPALDLAGTAAEYLSELELAGRVFPEADPLLERMAREASARSRTS